MMTGTHEVFRPTVWSRIYERALERAEGVRSWWNEDQAMSYRYFHEIYGMYTVAAMAGDKHTAGLLYEILATLKAELGLQFFLNNFMYV